MEKKEARSDRGEKRQGAREEKRHRKSHLFKARFNRIILQEISTALTFLM